MDERRSSSWTLIQTLAEALAKEQKEKLLQLGRYVIPTLTPEDVMQPNDYPELENHPEFRYEEGVLAGILSLQAALRALQKDQES